MLAFTIFGTQANTVSAAVDSATASAKKAAAYVDTSSNFKHLYGDVRAGVMGLASGLKVGAEHVYGVLVKQQIVYSITWLIIIIMLIIFTKIFQKVYLHAKREWDDEVAFFFFTALSGLGLVAGYIIVACNLTSIITGFVNPEYGAIQDIINFIK